jgi:hypothetical protein
MPVFLCVFQILQLGPWALPQQYSIFVMFLQAHFSYAFKTPYLSFFPVWAVTEHRTQYETFRVTADRPEI